MSKVIREVVYEVTGEFGVNAIGERRKAFVLGSDGGDLDTVLLFHPKDESGSGSVEFAQIKNDGQGGEPVYVSAITSSNSGVSYLNFDSHTEKFYRNLVKEAGFEIPRDLTINQDDEPTQPARRVRKTP